MPVRIYDIAKKLGIESKEVLAKAKALGITAAKVPSSSLDKITAEYLEIELGGLRPATPAPAPAPELVLITAPPPEPPPAPVAEPLSPITEPITEPATEPVISAEPLVEELPPPPSP